MATFIDLEDSPEAREARINRHAASVAMDMVTRDDGAEYPSVSAAARALGADVKPDQICQAIKRRGKCKGFRFAYLDDIPPNFWRDLEDSPEAREARISRHAARVAMDMVAEAVSRCAEVCRGSARMVTRDDGAEYPSVSAAARALGADVKPDWICQAIKRRGKCKGFRFAYLDDIPPNFWRAMPEGSACPWPFRRGNPVVNFSLLERADAPHSPSVGN